jgi:hypothetical protein
MIRRNFLAAALLSLVLGRADAQNIADVGEFPVITFEFAGAHVRGMAGGERFSLQIFSDGLIVYFGESRVRVQGAVRTRVPAETVARWLNTLIDGGFADAKDSTPPQDTHWYRFTVALPQGRKTLNFYGSNPKSYLVAVREDIIKTVDPFKRWVEYRQP